MPSTSAHALASTSTAITARPGASAAEARAPGQSTNAAQLKQRARTLDFAAGEAAMAPPGEPPADTRKAAENGPQRNFPVEAEMVRSKYRAHAVEASEMWGVSVNDILAVICMEADKKKWETENEGDFRGLMQLGAAAWSAVITKYGAMTLPGGTTPLRDYDYATYVTDARVSVHFAAAYLGIAAGQAKSTVSRRDGTLSLDETDLTTQLIAYNAGPGNMAALVSKASKLSTGPHESPTDPAVFTRAEVVRAVFEPSIRAKAEAALEGLTPEQAKIKRPEVEKAIETALQRKCDEVASYYVDAAKYIVELEKLDAADPALAEKKSADPEVDEEVEEVEPVEKIDEQPAFGAFRDTPIKLGDRSPAVRELLLILKRVGYRSAPTPNTDAPQCDVYISNLVKLFQSTHGLTRDPATPDVVVDEATWSALLQAVGAP